jgi:hypothetical protein
MTADRARISYDRSRDYRMLVKQQGRVTLEADDNEAAAIASEALRLETIDVIGPVGAAGTGYLPVSGTGASGVSVGPGVFYLGGWRFELLDVIDLAGQPDWLDQPATTIASGSNFLVTLLANEQVVGAAEDQAQREVALGGPDSAARDRLMQHFLRLPLTGTTCADGATLIAQQLANEGVSIDATSQIISPARLQVAFVPGPASTDPCTPSASGGYLGADNQLIRVTIIDYDANAKTGTLLWGWNNASIMYRASATDAFHLTLTGTPVDAEHAPQQTQAVEVLDTQAQLDDDQNYIAAAQGFITTLESGYSSATAPLDLNDQLPGNYTPANPTTPLFLRLWQAMVPFTLGQATALDDVSGITVTITSLTATIVRIPPPTQISLRPFWCFAVRPTTSTLVYPQRYLEGPQPPEGPRQWIADLAVMQATSNGVSLLQSCLVPFMPLTQQQGGCQCCMLTLGVNDIAARGGLQAVMDSLPGKYTGLSLLPGTYPLAAPLELTEAHAGLTLEACGGTVTLQASAQDLTPFFLGIIGLNGAAGVTLRGLTIVMPLVPLGTDATSAQSNIGVFVYASANLTVEACVFQASVPTATATVDGAGLAIAGQSPGLVARRNSFVGGAFASGSLVSGIAAIATAATPAATIDGADISGNQFQQLTFGVFAFIQLGQVRCADNRVSACATGLFFADVNLAAATEIANEGLTEATDGTKSGFNTGAGINYTMQAPSIAAFTKNFDQYVGKLPQPPQAPAMGGAGHQVLLSELTTRGAQIWTALNASSTTRTTRARTTQGGGAETPKAQAAAFTYTPIAKDMADKIKVSLATLQGIAIAAEMSDTVVPPVLHISGNDVSLAAVDATLAPGIGIAAIFSPRDENGTVLLCANRVLTADPRTTAAAVLFPTAEAVTGNVFMQPTGEGAKERTQSPAFVSLAEASVPVEVMGNVIVVASFILPVRASSAATTSWDFLNTVA